MDGVFIGARDTHPLRNTNWSGSVGTSSSCRSGTDRSADPSGGAVFFPAPTRSSPGADREWSVGNHPRGGRLDRPRLPRRQLTSTFSANRPAITQNHRSPFHVTDRGGSASEPASDRKKNRGIGEDNCSTRLWGPPGDF